MEYRHTNRAENSEDTSLSISSLLEAQEYTDPELLQFLSEHNAEVITIPSNESEQSEVPIIQIDSPWPFKDIDLPEGYAVVGGAARAAVLSTIDGTYTPPRDIDIVAVKELANDVSEETIKSLSEKYCEDDARFGNGIKVLSLDQHFKEQDFGMNEIAVFPDKILCTPDAIHDLYHKVIHPTQFEQTEGEQGPHVRFRLFLKGLRLRDEMQELYGEGHFSAESSWDFLDDTGDSKELALNISKALERGDEISKKFFQTLLDHGIVTQNIYDENTPSGVDIHELTENLQTFLSHPYDFYKGKENPYKYENILTDLDELMEIEDKLREEAERTSFRMNRTSEERNLRAQKKKDQARIDEIRDSLK